MKEIIQIRRPMPKYKRLLKTFKIMVDYGVRWEPYYIMRLARNIILSTLYKKLGIKKYVLRGVEFLITYDCNFKCQHCECAKLDKKFCNNSKKIMFVKDYKTVVEEAMKLGTVGFCLGGGEAMLRKDWTKIVKACQPDINRIMIATNGWLFNEEKAKLCKEIGVDSINFSLDSFDPKTHDKFRNMTGSYERVIKGVKLCKKYKLKALVNVVIHKGNLYTRDFINILEWAETNNIFIAACFAKGVGAFKNTDLMLDDEDFKNYFEIVKPYSCIHCHHFSEFNNNFLHRGCASTKDMLDITPHGDVIPCQFVHVSLGNVLEESLRTIRERALKLPLFGEYTSCFLITGDVMEKYYSLFKNKDFLTLQEFKKGMK